MRVKLIATATAALMTLSAIADNTGHLKSLPNARLQANANNDGDSLSVSAGDAEFIIRLYFADCPETGANAPSDTRRIREQARYFGLPNAERVIHFGQEAKNFTTQALAKPFTIHTAGARAPGRSRKGRIYAFVTTADGDDLATLLVKNGLARPHGTTRTSPAGVSGKDTMRRLKDIETAAMLNRKGIWSESDSAKIVESRSEQRREDSELKSWSGKAAKTAPDSLSVDINNASAEELRQVPGIGPALAVRIIAGRPYNKIDELKKVRGIGDKNLEKMRLHLKTGD